MAQKQEDVPFLGTPSLFMKTLLIIPIQLFRLALASNHKGLC